MKTILAAMAAIGLASGSAFAGCAGHTAQTEKPDTVASLSVPMSAAGEATAEAPVDDAITTGSVATEAE